MKNRFKLAFVVLLIATIVWGILFYLILQEYYKFVEGLSELERMWGLWDPWWRWNGMPYVITAGIGLLCAWMLLMQAIYHQQKVSGKRTQNKRFHETYPQTCVQISIFYQVGCLPIFRVCIGRFHNKKTLKLEFIWILLKGSYQEIRVIVRQVMNYVFRCENL